jgi:hypothetical protein
VTLRNFDFARFELDAGGTNTVGGAASGAASVWMLKNDILEGHAAVVASGLGLHNSAWVGRLRVVREQDTLSSRKSFCPYLYSLCDFARAYKSQRRVSTSPSINLKNTPPSLDHRRHPRSLRALRGAASSTFSAF